MNLRPMIGAATFVIGVIAAVFSVSPARSQQLLCAPNSAVNAFGRQVGGAPSGTPYILNGQGCANINTTDISYFLSQGYTSNSSPASANLSSTKLISFTGTSIATLGAITGGSGYTPATVIKALGTITAGSGYVAGFYSAVPLTGGTGSGATANITVGSGGTVVAVALSATGSGYTINDTLSASNANLGGSGTGFSIPVSSTQYVGVVLIGGMGSGAKANIAVTAGGAVNAVVLTATGTGYAVNDVLSASAASIGGSGSGFSIPVSAVGAGTSTTNSIINVITSASGNCIDLSRCVTNLVQVTDTVNNLSPGSMYHNRWVSTTSCTACGTGRFFNSMEGTVSGSGVTTPVGAQFTTLGLNMTLQTNLGGIQGATSGGVFTFNPQTTIGAGASHINGAANSEFDFAVAAGVDYLDMSVVGVVLGSAHRSAGTRTNVAFYAAAQANTTSNGGLIPPFDVMIQEGGFNGTPASSTIFRCYPHASPTYGASGNCGALLYGLDFSQYLSVTNYIVLGPQSNGYIDGNFNVRANGMSMPLTTPASSSATCVQGATVWDASFIYICTATNTWKRATLATF